MRPARLAWGKAPGSCEEMQSVRPHPAPGLSPDTSFPWSQALPAPSPHQVLIMEFSWQTQQAQV